MTSRRCELCGRPAANRRGPARCNNCRVRPQPNRQRVTNLARGYGGDHQRLRKQWAPKVARGEVRCWRCGLPILPGGEWDLGHNDFDRRLYNRPEHARCNRGAWARKGSRQEPAQHDPLLFLEPGVVKSPRICPGQAPQ